MSENDILEWLQNEDSRTGILFKEFLSKHGHRCYGEFDIYKRSWSQNPIEVIQSIKVFVVFMFLKTQKAVNSKIINYYKQSQNDEQKSF